MASPDLTTLTPLHIERFWHFVLKKRGCWLWQGEIMPSGYGRFPWGTRQRMMAHRLCWFLTYGPIPDLIHVCHNCDTRPCVRPDHLFLGTNADNMADMVRKGRQARGKTHGSRTKPNNKAYGELNGKYTHPEARFLGEKHWKAKLLPEDILHIRSLQGKMSSVQVASLYNVKYPAIQKIWNRTNWRHI